MTKLRNIMGMLILTCLSYSLTAQQQNLISGKYSREQLQQVLIPYAKWTPFPRLNDRDGWAKADPAMMQAYVAKAETFLKYEWPYIPATKSLLIARTGDRDEYQSVSFKKREVLGTLILAEIAENKGRYIDQMVDGIWSICEESFWGVPAHLPQGKDYAGLMDVSSPFVDLFAAETATYLAWADYFFGDKFDAISPQIRKRIYHETNRRVFQPLLLKPHGWMKTNDQGRRPNNWNPWICSNWINAVLLLERNDSLRAAGIYKALTVLDDYMNPHPMDGGCDEGPSYWGAAAASLYDNMAMLNRASRNAFDYVYQDAKFINMGRFIYRAQISERYFLNFADADPQPGLSANMIYRYGKDIGDQDMMKFGAYYRKPETGQVGKFHFFRIFFSLFMQDEYRNAAKGLPYPKDVWLPDLQVMAARDKKGTSDGFYVAVKGGNNDESHNHNDIGNYVVYYDGLPVLIDVGRGTYTRKTFSSKRYDIWYNCSDYHNVPAINGYNQPPGGNYKASDVVYNVADSWAQMSLEMAGAYPPEAGVRSLKRTVRMNRGKNVEVTDVVQLARADALVQYVMTCHPAETGKSGEMIVHAKTLTGVAQDFKILYDAKQFKATVEKVALTAPEDKGIQTKWGDTIYRISFRAAKTKKSDKMKFTIALR